MFKKTPTDSWKPVGVRKRAETPVILKYPEKVHAEMRVILKQPEKVRLKTLGDGSLEKVHAETSRKTRHFKIPGEGP